MLYTQNLENPTGFVNIGADVDGASVNSLLCNQPPGFTFRQQFTVETIHTGTAAFGTGYSDPSGIGGNYALGILSDAQDDKLGLSFNVGAHQFLNFGLYISSIHLSAHGWPFIPPGGLVPLFRFTLFDNPGGVGALGSGTVLDTFDASGTISARDIFNWTAVVTGLDASGNTDGNVTLQIDLLSGGYAAMDNFCHRVVGYRRRVRQRAGAFHRAAVGCRDGGVRSPPTRQAVRRHLAPVVSNSTASRAFTAVANEPIERNPSSV